MIRLFFLLSIFLSIRITVEACSFSPDSFCHTYFGQDDRVVLTGVILSTDTTGIDLLVLQVIRGEETRDTIRIWDGTDFDCNGIWSMAASDIGVPGDTIIIIPEMIEEIENGWDVIGDYRRPHPYTKTPELHIVNGHATGFISGISNAPPEYKVLEADYDTLVAVLQEASNCADLHVSTVEAGSSIRYYTNPVSSMLHIQLHEAPVSGSLRLYDTHGRVVSQTSLSDRQLIEVDVLHLPSGIYFVEVSSRKKRDLLKVIRI